MSAKASPSSAALTPLPFVPGVTHDAIPGLSVRVIDDPKVLAHEYRQGAAGLKPIPSLWGAQ